MSEPISIEINGGEPEERVYISDVIENALNTAGFNEIQNTVFEAVDEISSERTKTLFDYAINKNPDLFTQPIEITATQDESPEDTPVIDDEVTISEEEEEAIY